MMKVFYLRDKQQFPVACVATERTDRGIVYALSTYNLKDDFDRATGRKIAVGRLKENRITGGPFAVEPGVKIKIMREIATNPRLPSDARKAAKFWLKPEQAEARLAHSKRTWHPLLRQE